jgi:hypothetical protein
MAAQKRQRVRAKAKAVDPEDYTPLEQHAIWLHEYYKSLRKAGFPVDQALTVMMDKSSWPEWVTPKIPVDQPGTDWDEDED